jgi:pyruvate-ferredoxin/flavodoxin oxidoreductase
MSKRKWYTLDGNEAVAYVSYRVNEVVGIYPITPSSPVAEWADEWAAQGKKNLWGTVPLVVEMQSEGGAAGVVHGSLQAGAMSTTVTASQGLLLMIPNMYKIAGERTATVFNVAARTLATHALSIFGDHSDVMSTRSAGWALLSSASVQEAHDFTLIAQASTLKARLPFIHFFDGFRTSHEVSKIELLNDDDMRALIDDKLIQDHRDRALTPDHPQIRGTAQNPDVFFQGQEAGNPFYNACPDIVQEAMDKFAAQVGRSYHLFDYVGAADAERVVVLMGSGCETVDETIEYLVKKGEKVGALKVRLFRPFDMKRCVEALPASVKALAVLDRCKEPGATGEPLYTDVLTALHEGLENGVGKLKAMPKVVGGRYGISSKEFTPAMVVAVFDNLKQAKPKNHFTIGINDDVTHTSLPWDAQFSIEPNDVVRCLFYGLGADGTVGANKNSIKIIGEDTPNYAQGYFVYDSKKSGAMTVSHLRFGPRPIKSIYLIDKANFVACHQPVFLDRYDMLASAVPGSTFLLNTHHSKDEVWDKLPKLVQEQLVAKKMKLFVIDANHVARECGMGGRINTVMQVCFFALANVLPREEAVEAIKKSIKKTYGKKGEEIVAMNLKVVDSSLQYMHEVKVPAAATGTIPMRKPVPDSAPEFVRKVEGEIIAGRGDLLPVSAMPLDGTFPTGTTQYEKRDIALEIPVWDADICIQCGKCAMVCPHAVIRIKAYEPAAAAGAPASFKLVDFKDAELKGLKYSIQVSPDDCTGCGLCADVCPAKSKTDTKHKALDMMDIEPLRAQEGANWDFFLKIKELDRRKLKVNQVRHQQMQQPLFEFSGACAGCGETPYVKLLTQLYGDRLLIANATGCSSIYGGNLPTTPYAKNKAGRGPAWANSLFEDNAEFGMGMRVAVDKQAEMARELLALLAAEAGEGLAKGILENPQKDEVAIQLQREQVADLKKKLSAINKPEAKRLLGLADYLVRKSVWILGGDGWAYDIGYGGLDHVMASGRNVKILVLDTEVYSNTGGQASKSTPRGAVAKFAAGGKALGKKDLGLIAMSYGNVYVARVVLGSNDALTLKAFLEAEAYDGPALIIAYSHCIAHGINMSHGLQEQKMIVESGQWANYRFNPTLAAEGKNPFMLDSKAAKRPVSDFMYGENRFKMLTKSKPEVAAELLKLAQADADAKFKYYEYLANRPYPATSVTGPGPIA